MATGFHNIRKQGLFGNPFPTTYEGPWNEQPFPTQPAGMPTPKKGGGFFGEGGAGRAIAGSIGDFLLQAYRMQPIYGPAMQEKRALQQKYAMEQFKALQDRAEFDRQRALGNQDWLARYDYEAKNPKKSVGLFEDNAGNRWTYDTATGQVIGDTPAHVDRTPRQVFQGDKVIDVPNPYTPSPDAVNYLRTHPETWRDFDAKYGSGLAQKLLGVR